MYNYQIIIFFICLFSYIYSTLKVNKIEPSTVIFSEDVEFNLTVQDYDSSNNYNITIGVDFNPSLIEITNCILRDSLLTCESYIFFSDKIFLNDFPKYLYINNVNTGLSISIEKPTIIKLLKFENYEKYYINCEIELHFQVNYNELYNSKISIKFGDISITNCKIDNLSVKDLYCYYKFSEVKEEDLFLIFNGENTDESIKIYEPVEFSQINNLNINVYYESESIQDFYFNVDSSFKINEHSIVLVPENSIKSNITLSNCRSFDIGLTQVKCSGLLNTIGKYYINIDTKNTDKFIVVYPEITSINKIYSIYPNFLYISSSRIIFSITVDYVVNLEKTDIILQDEYNIKNKIYLVNCSKVEKINNNIECIAIINKASIYWVYLNGINQFINITAQNFSLSKAFDIEPHICQFKKNKIQKVGITFDSLNDFSQKKLF